MLCLGTYIAMWSSYKIISRRVHKQVGTTEEEGYPLEDYCLTFPSDYYRKRGVSNVYASNANNQYIFGLKKLMLYR